MKLPRSVILALANGSSMVLGFVRELIAARLFGASRELDLFLLCFMPFDLMLAATRDVPVALQGRLARLDELASNRVIVTVSRYVVGAAIVAALCYLIVYECLIPQGFLATSLRNWTPVCLFIAAAIPVAATHIPLSALGIHKHGLILFHGYQQIYLNAAIAGCLLIFGAAFGVAAMAFGVLLGTALLMGHEYFRLRADVRECLSVPAVPTAGRDGLVLMLVFVAAQAIGGKAAMLVERTVGLSLSPGAISQLNYALRVWGIPVNLFVIAAIVPYSARFAARVAAEDYHAAYRMFTRLVFGLLAAFAPFTIVMAFFGHDVVTVLFQSGRFTAEDSDAVTHLLRFLLLGSFGLLASSAAVYTLWTFGRSISVTAVTWACVAGYGALSWALTRVLGITGLVVSNVIYYNVQAICLLLLVRREFRVRLPREAASR